MGAFDECINLISIVVPSTINKIGQWSFSHCSALKDFYIYAENCPDTDKNTFEETPIENATLHVPAASVETYKQTAPWSGFGKIVALTDNDPKPAGIRILEADDHLYPVSIYSIDGRRSSNPQHGLNIIRMSDGTTKKVLLK